MVQPGVFSCVMPPVRSGSLIRTLYHGLVGGGPRVLTEMTKVPHVPAKDAWPGAKNWRFYVLQRSVLEDPGAPSARSSNWRTQRASATGVKGFCKKASSLPRPPLRTIEFSV